MDFGGDLSASARAVRYLDDPVKTTYTRWIKQYLAQRKLRRHARVLQLWAMGVGAVISGDFFGWNFGLAAGGLRRHDDGASWS